MFLSKYFSYFWLFFFVLNTCFFLDTFMGQPICAATVVLSSALSALRLLHCTYQTTTSSARARHCLALLNIVLPGHIHLYRFLKSSQSSVGKLKAKAALLPRVEPPPRRLVKTEWLNGWQRGPDSLFIPSGSEESLWPLPVINTRFFLCLDGSLNMNPAPQGS
jgi:hypothetical protein